MQDNNLDKVNVELKNYTNKILENLPVVSQLFKAGNVNEASKIFSQIIEGLEWVDKYVSIVSKGNSDALINDMKVKDIRYNFMNTVAKLMEEHKEKKWDEVSNTIDNNLIPDLNNYFEILNNNNDK